VKKAAPPPRKKRPSATKSNKKSSKEEEQKASSSEPSASEVSDIPSKEPTSLLAGHLSEFIEGVPKPVQVGENKDNIILVIKV